MASSSKTLLSVDKINALQELRKDFLCQICGEIFEDPMMPSTGCDHKYCEECIYSHFRVGNSCPVCKLPLVPKDLRQCHKLGEILSEFKKLNEMYAIIQKCTSKINNNKNNKGNKKDNNNNSDKPITNNKNNDVPKATGENGNKDESKYSESLLKQNSKDNVSQTSINDNDSEQDNASISSLNKKDMEDPALIASQSSVKNVSQTSINDNDSEQDNASISSLNKKDMEDPALIASQSSVSPSKHLFPTSTTTTNATIERVQGSFDYDNNEDDNHYNDPNIDLNQRASTFVVEETMDMQESLNSNNDNQNMVFSETPMSNNNINNHDNDDNDDDDDSSSSDSNSSDDDDDYDENLIDLNQLKKQIEKEENELKELQGKTNSSKDENISDENNHHEHSISSTKKRNRGGDNSSTITNKNVESHELRVLDKNVIESKRRRVTKGAHKNGINPKNMNNSDEDYDPEEDMVLTNDNDDSNRNNTNYIKKAVFVASMLSHDQKGQVEDFLSKSWALKYNPSLQNDVDIHTTHVITRTATKASSNIKALQCRRTIKYFHGVAVQAWIISIDWIVECLKQNKWVDEEQYEIVCGDKDPTPKLEDLPTRGLILPMGGARRSRLKRFPLNNFESMVDFNSSRSRSLLNGYKVCVWHNFQQVRLDREKVVKLCNLSGATIIEEEDLPKKMNNDTYDDNVDQDYWPKKVVLICPQVGMSVRAAKSYEQGHDIYVVNHTWLLDTVSQNDIKNPTNHNFSFTKLGRGMDDF